MHESSIYGFDPNAPGNEQIAQQISGEVLQKLVDEVLLRQAASRAGISASPEEVDTQVLMDMMNTGGQDQLEQVLSLMAIRWISTASWSPRISPSASLATM